MTSSNMTLPQTAWQEQWHAKLPRCENRKRIARVGQRHEKLANTLINTIHKQC